MPNTCSRRSALLVLVLAACSSGSEPSTPLLEANGTGAVNLSAAGAGEAEFEFVAQVMADGKVTGTFRQSRSGSAGTVDFAGVVTCLTTDKKFPGRARIGGVVTRNNSTNPAFRTTDHEVGDDVWFRVQDGGNGPGADDRSTTYGFKPVLVNTSAEYCALPFDGLPAWNPASIFPLARGTISVKDNKTS